MCFINKNVTPGALMNPSHYHNGIATFSVTTSSSDHTPSFNFNKFGQVEIQVQRFYFNVDCNNGKKKHGVFIQILCVKKGKHLIYDITKVLSTATSQLSCLTKLIHLPINITKYIFKQFCSNNYHISKTTTCHSTYHTALQKY